MDKYEALSEALKRATAAALEAVARDPEDGGTCNFDAPAIALPRWNEAKVKAAAEAAGTGCYSWKLFGEKLFVFPIRAGGQGNSRTRAAEAAERSLKADGYNATMYYQMD